MAMSQEEWYSESNFICVSGHEFSIPKAVLALDTYSNGTPEIRNRSQFGASHIVGETGMTVKTQSTAFCAGLHSPETQLQLESRPGVLSS